MILPVNVSVRNTQGLEKSVLELLRCYSPYSFKVVSK